MGAYFVRAGHDVTFVDIASEHVAALTSSGLKIEGPLATFSVTAPAFTPTQLEGQWQTVLLCTKGHHTEAAVKALTPFLAPDGYVVSVQNGLNEQLIAGLIGRDKTVGSFVNFGADYLAPGLIHYGGRGAVVLGELDGTMTERLEQLHQLFLSFDDRAIVTPNIWGYLWGKMAYGALLYATALTNDSIADALANPDYADLFIAVAQEVTRLTLAQGITAAGFNGFDPPAFAPDAPAAAAHASLAAMVAFNRKSAKTHSGIWRDLAVRKRQTEVDAHLGMMVDIGRQEAVETPLLAAMVRQIHQIEAGERELSLANLTALQTYL